jgi:hypothetical protein
MSQVLKILVYTTQPGSHSTPVKMDDGNANLHVCYGHPLRPVSS